MNNNKKLILKENLYYKEKNLDKRLNKYFISQTKIIKFFIIFILIIFDINLSINISIYFYRKYLKNMDKKSNNNHNLKFDSIYESFKRAKYFLYKSIKGDLIQDKNDFKLSLRPKISTVIPVYNSEKYISKSIRSIQNQDILNLEIILVNDCSSDNTLSFIEHLKNKDPRIKILNNKSNMGILYSRSIGVLCAKGHYIFSLDNDDMFLDIDVFSNIYNIANEGNFDIIKFQGILSRLGGKNILKNKIQHTYFSNQKLNFVLFQPELSSYPIRAGSKVGTYCLNEVYVWDKCIKTNIYQKALNKLDKKKYSRYMLGHEDIIAMIILFNTAKSYKSIAKYGIFHIERYGSAYSKTKGILYDIKELYLAEVFIDFAKNTKENNKLIVYLIINLLNIKLLPQIINDKNEYNKKLIISCLNKVLNSNFISKKYKNEIRKKGKKLKINFYPF